LHFVLTAAMFCEHAKPRGAGCENSERRRGIICSDKAQSSLLFCILSSKPQALHYFLGHMFFHFFFRNILRKKNISYFFSHAFLYWDRNYWHKHPFGFYK